MIGTATVATAAVSPGFFGAMTGFATGLLLTWPALVALVLLGILFEYHGNHRWVVFTGLITTAVAYFFFGVSLAGLGIGAAIYIPIGLVWSWYRYKRHANDAVELAGNMNIIQKEMLIHKLHPKEMLGTIVQWILIWPFSMVENIVGDLIKAIESLVTRWFRGVYHTIYDAAVKSILNK